jgi:ABC-type antimicrobial peptide transport system permease subunit
MQESAAGFVLRRIRTMEAILGTSLTEARAIAGTVGSLAALALGLAVLGLYGLVSYLVALRTRELGIRMALGAAPADVLRLVLRLGLQLVLAGGVAGLLAGAGGARLLRGMLYATATAELPTIAAVAALMAAVGVAACVVPALRAMRTPPSVTLRAE